MFTHLTKIMENQSLKISHYQTAIPNPNSKIPQEDFIISIPDLLSDKHYSLHIVVSGHGGPQSALCVSKIYPKLLSEGFMKENKKNISIKEYIKLSLKGMDALLKKYKVGCGTSFSGILIDNFQKKIFSINLGDSTQMRFLINKDFDNIEIMNEKHNLDNLKEKERFEKNKIEILQGRVGGMLKVTRALGDFYFRQHGVISEPDIREFEFEKDSIILIGSYGVFDFVKKETIRDLLLDGDIICKEIGDDVVNTAVKNGSNHNISLIVLHFHN